MPIPRAMPRAEWGFAETIRYALYDAIVEAVGRRHHYQ
jgi:hypothetical protein